MLAGMDLVDLDWNATAPLLPAARDAWLAAYAEAGGNPSSIHGRGQAARALLDEARARIAARLGCRAHELVLTSGGSEANATAIAHALAGGGPAAALAVEHSSVLRACRAAADTALVPVDGDGLADPAALAAVLPAGCRLLCVQFANNESGVVQPVAALAAAARAARPDIHVHVDACQGAGKIEVRASDLGADTVAVAGHKLGAPKGIGVLVVRAGCRLRPLIHGGRQQQDRRSGTEDPALAMALAAALDHHASTRAAESDRQRALLRACADRIRALVPDAVWLGERAPRLPNTLLIARPDRDAEILVQRLDLAGFAVSRGAACMAGRGEASHVVRAMGVPDRLALGALRVSIGHLTTADELDRFAEVYAGL
ncbi:MAG: hypothetical protein RLZZ127_2423 [Planctomycetota bacterium]|jgi:cysteine desulfurase